MKAFRSVKCTSRDTTIFLVWMTSLVAGALLLLPVAASASVAYTWSGSDYPFFTFPVDQSGTATKLHWMTVDGQDSIGGNYVFDCGSSFANPYFQCFTGTASFNIPSFDAGEASITIPSGGMAISTGTYVGTYYGVGYNAHQLEGGASSSVRCWRYPSLVDPCSGSPYVWLTDSSGTVLAGFAAPYVIDVTNDITTNTTWVGNHVYKVSGNVVIESGVTVTIQPGAIIKFDTATSSGFTVEGTLNAVSTTTPIYFTSLNDDSVGGDTNFYGASTSPAVGDWHSIEVSSGGFLRIQKTNILYGGNSSSANVYINGGDVIINNTTIASSSNSGILVSAGNLNIASSTIYHSSDGIYVTGGTSVLKSIEISNNSNYGIYTSGASIEIDASNLHDNTYGVYVGSGSLGDVVIHSSNLHNNSYGAYINGGTASLGSNSFHDNSNYAVFSNNSGATVPATYNYWGASDGPSGQGAGSGDAVSSYVDFSNYLNTEHYIQVDYSGNLISSVGGGNEIDWDGNPAPYQSAWYASLDVWNDLGSITVATDTVLTLQDLTISTSSDPDLSWAGLWDPSSIPDSITLNGYYFDTYSENEKINVITHELGHALGLAHSYSGNMMYYTIVGTTTLNTQDRSDYYFLWP